VSHWAVLTKTLAAGCNGLASAVRWAVLLLALTMLASLMLQVVMRYVFNQAPTWTEELAVTCFSWSMLLSIGLGVRHGIHVRMDLLVDRLPAIPRQWLERLVSLTIALAGIFIAWYGVLYVLDSGGGRSAAIGYPLGWLYACAPACGLLIAVFGLEHMLHGRTPAATPTSL